MSIFGTGNWLFSIELFFEVSLMEVKLFIKSIKVVIMNKVTI